MQPAHTHRHDRNWHDRVFFGIHYDLHASATDTNLGAELTADHLRAELERVRPDWIQVDCKGHAGYTSWPTQVGSTSPGVVRDSLRIQRDVTAELGIKLGMHYSGVWDSRAIELHPDWARINERGERDSAMTCRMSGYLDELMIPQMLELIEGYDVDGFWVDGENWASKPCWCDRCRAEFTRRTGITAIPMDKTDPAWETWLAFHRDLFEEHVTRYAEAVHTAKPTCMVCSNWAYTVRQPDPVAAPVDYLSGDYTWAWGAERAAVEGRLLDSRSDQISWDLMAWGFTKTGSMRQDPPWVLKSALHLCQEVAEVVALGGAIMIYGKPQRSGWLTSWHQETLAEVAAFCRARQELCFRTTTVPQAAVLHGASHLYGWHAEHYDAATSPFGSPLYNYGEAVQPVEGALHALLETHHSTDLLTEEAALARLQDYALAVVPEQTRLHPDIVAALDQYAQGGGHVVISGAHLSREWPDLVGADPAGDLLETPPTGGWGVTQLALDDPRAHARSVGVSGPWQPVNPRPGTQVWGYRLIEQEPSKDTADQVVVTQRRVGQGSVVAVHGPIFRDYFRGHYPPLRRWIAGLLARLEIPWLVQVDGPPWLELILRRKNDRLLVNLIHRGAGEMLSPNRVMVEELPPVRDVTLRIRTGQPPAAVRVEPSGQTPQYDFADGILTVHVPQVAVHEVVVIQ